MSVRRYGPDETWPTHDKKHWHEPLEEARQAGWTLIYINASHRFGVVSCPAGQHTFEVDKTAKGSETKALEARKKIRWCDHPPKGTVRDQSDKSRELLDVASQLTAEVAVGLREAEARQDSQEELDRLEIQLNTAASNVEEILLAAQETALLAAIATDDAPDPPVLAAKLVDATTAVTESETAAKSVKAQHPGVARPLLERAEKLRARIIELRSQLETLQERIGKSLG